MFPNVLRKDVSDSCEIPHWENHTITLLYFSCITVHPNGKINLGDLFNSRSFCLVIVFKIRISLVSFLWFFYQVWLFWNRHFIRINPSMFPLEEKSWESSFYLYPHSYFCTNPISFMQDEYVNIKQNRSSDTQSWQRSPSPLDVSSRFLLLSMCDSCWFI